MTRVVVVGCDGRVRLDDVDPGSLAEYANGIVGGWAAVEPVRHGVEFLVSEVRKLEDLPFNRPATALFWELGGDNEEWLCGSVVVTTTAGPDRTTVAEVLDKLRLVGGHEVTVQ